MKVQCESPSCGHVYSITCDPNEHEGYFISVVALDKHDGKQLTAHKMRSYGAIRANQCPKCKLISPV